MNQIHMGYSEESTEQRFQALNFLIANYDKWPTKILDRAEISIPKFESFRFIRSSDDKKIYFADCIVRGISEGEFLEFKGKCKDTFDLFEVKK